MIKYGIKVKSLDVWIIEMDTKSFLSERINPKLFDTEQEAIEYANSMDLKDYKVDQYVFE